MLNEHQINILNVLDEIECTNACIMNDRCQSYNYGNTAGNNGLHVCELNKQVVGATISTYLVEAQGFSYYEEPQTIKVSLLINYLGVVLSVYEGGREIASIQKLLIFENRISFPYHYENEHVYIDTSWKNVNDVI